MATLRQRLNRKNAADSRDCLEGFTASYGLSIGLRCDHDAGMVIHHSLLATYQDVAVRSGVRSREWYLLTSHPSLLRGGIPLLMGTTSLRAVRSTLM